MPDPILEADDLDILGKPYPNEHSARLKAPDGYVRFRRQNDKFGSGIHAIFGVTKAGKAELQAIRFDKSKFTVAQARKWLKDHDHKPIRFEPASGKARDNLTEKAGDISANRGEEPADPPTKESEVTARDGKMDAPAVDKRLLSDHKYMEMVDYNLVVGKDAGEDAGNGYVEGYASQFGRKDLQNEVVKKGAFTKTLAEQKGKRPFMVKHLGSGGDILECVGAITDAGEDNYGLKFHADFLDDPASQAARAKMAAMRAAGIKIGTSIGYRPVKNHYDDKDSESLGGAVALRTLVHDEVALLEITATLRPANEGASITDGKTEDDAQTIPALQTLLAGVTEATALNEKSRLISDLGGEDAVDALVGSLEDLIGKARLLVEKPAAVDADASGEEPQDTDADAGGTPSAGDAATADAEADQHSSEDDEKSRKDMERKRIAAAAIAKAALYE